jgi:hypothetical protein
MSETLPLSSSIEQEIDVDALRKRRYSDAATLGLSKSVWSQILGVIDFCETMGNIGPCALLAKPGQSPGALVLIPATNHEYVLSFDPPGHEFPIPSDFDKFELSRRSLDHPGDAHEKLMEGYFGSLVDLTRLSSWILEGQEPQLTEYQRLCQMFEEGQRRGIC